MSKRTAVQALDDEAAKVERVFKVATQKVIGALRQRDLAEAALTDAQAAQDAAITRRYRVRAAREALEPDAEVSSGPVAEPEVPPA